MINEFISYITRREGRKFLQLETGPVDSLTMGQVPRDEISLYVHIPFCRSLCPFCCFNRYLFREELARRYFSDLRAELEHYAGAGFRFASVYFGGGTPTVLMDELLSFIHLLRRRFSFRELSLETTPRELTSENIRRLQEAGVNRLSIGVQSFDEHVLRAMGRDNGPAAEVKKRLLEVQGRFATLNVDFVFNFPGQTVAQFAADVAAFKELGIDQATFYPLMASPHKQDALERKFNRVDKSRERQFYEVILSSLYHDGYKASTAWCFSRGEHMIDEYIIEYDEYVGIGAGSVSIVGGNFLVNTFSLDRYHEMVTAGKLPVVGWRRLRGKEAWRYYFLTRLFGLRLDLDAMSARFGREAVRRLWPEITFFRALGLIAGDGLLRVTEKGLYPVSVIMRDFFTSLNTLREYCIERRI